MVMQLLCCVGHIVTVVTRMDGKEGGINYSPTRSRSIENAVVAVVVLLYRWNGGGVGNLNTAASFLCRFLAIGLLYGNLDLVWFGLVRLSF